MIMSVMPFFLSSAVKIIKRVPPLATLSSFFYIKCDSAPHYINQIQAENSFFNKKFVIIYELLDEMMDFGYPQTTESKILQEYITQESHKLEIQVRPPMAVTNAVSWRSEGIRYRKNEVFLVSLRFKNCSKCVYINRTCRFLHTRIDTFLDNPVPKIKDVVESVNLLVNANGNVVRSEILGAVKMKCYLSGMPELRLGLNDKVMFESTGRSM